MLRVTVVIVEFTDVKFEVIVVDADWVREASEIDSVLRTVSFIWVCRMKFRVVSDPFVVI